MKYEKFDIGRALAGEPVITRSGAKAYIRYKEEDIKLKYPLMGVVLGEPSNGEFWTLCGTYYSNGYDSDQDIIGMYPKEPLTMPDYFWELLSPESVAIARDENGRWFSYGAVPVLHEIGSWKGWGWEEGHKNRYWNLTAFNPEIFPDCKPEDSLILRPTKEE